MRHIALLSVFLLVACDGGPATHESEIPGFNDLESQVKGERIGLAGDHWIEMKNLAGEWERTGLIFGYADDYEECTKAIAGLRLANDAREYRCTPAN
jgi:hypothetical protein